MNPNLICPKCQGELKVEHYRSHFSMAIYILQSRLICALPCDYKKEWPMPTELLTITLAKELKEDDKAIEKEVSSIVDQGA